MSHLEDLNRPILKYGSAAWDPYRNYQINWLKSVGRRTARFVTRTYNREEGCVTRALNRLNWQSLQYRRRVARLGLLHKADITKQRSPSHPMFYISPAPQLEISICSKFIPVQTSCDAYTSSFWPRTINDWNSLPPNILDNLGTINYFSGTLF